jgi:hypothetical protein
MKSRRTYNKIFSLLYMSHYEGDPSKRLMLENAIRMAHEYYHIPQRDCIDVWLDFFKQHEKVTGR